jgi:D-amino-acid dehydrogenase
VELRFADGTSAQPDLVIVAAGAWSKPLAAAMGDKVPLDTERGYNITFPSGRLGLTCPVVFEGEGFVATPLDTGDRVGGAVEFAGLSAPPNMARVDAILTRLKRFLPELDASGGERWMGFRPSLPDSLPVIGRSAATPRVLYAFGHGHYGLTQAAATAELVAAMAAGEAAPIDPAPFRPDRFRR